MAKQTDSSLSAKMEITGGEPKGNPMEVRLSLTSF